MIYNNILVHSFYRCGTNRFMHTVLSGYRAANIPAHRHDELFSKDSAKYDRWISLEKFESLSRSDNPFIVKLMDYDLFRLSEYEYKEFLNLLNKYNFYVIRIEREDLKELVFSNYIAWVTGEWIDQSETSIIADYEKLSRVFKGIMEKYVDQFLAQIRPIPYDEKIIYEDFLKDNRVKIGDIECIFDHSTKPSWPKHEKVLNYEEMESWYNDLYFNYMKERVND